MGKYFGQNRLTQILILLACIILLISAGSFIHIQAKLAVVEQKKEQLQKQINLHEEYLKTTEQLLEEVQDLRDENAELREQMENWLNEWEVEEMTVTAYAPLCDTAVEGFSYQGDPRITASGTKVVPGVTVAAGEDLPFGTEVWIEDLGWRKVQDRGGVITRGRLDVAVRSRAEAFRFGRQELKVVIPNGMEYHAGGR